MACSSAPASSSRSCRSRCTSAASPQRSIEAGDTVLQPLYVTGAIGTLHLLAGWDVWIPDGGYHAPDLANAGVNYWTVALEQALTWLPSPKVEVSANFVTSFRLKNPATNYQSGNDFDLDWVAGYRAWSNLPALQLGVQGFAYAQWTDDSVAARVVNGGNRGARVRHRTADPLRCRVTRPSSSNGSTSSPCKTGRRATASGSSSPCRYEPSLTPG